MEVWVFLFLVTLILNVKVRIDGRKRDAILESGDMHEKVKDAVES